MSPLKISNNNSSKFDVLQHFIMSLAGGIKILDTGNADSEGSNISGMYNKIKADSEGETMYGTADWLDQDQNHDN